VSGKQPIHTSSGIQEKGRFFNQKIMKRFRKYFNISKYPDAFHI